MNDASLLRRNAVRLLALSVIVVLYGFTRLPSLPDSERALLAERFDFQRLEMFKPAAPARSIRRVHPSLATIAGWISSVGAAVALADLDGDGLPNDICHVDPRFDSVVISPAPGTPARYEAFRLDPAPLPYDAGTMAPMGCLPGDYNEDGALDVLVYYWGRTPVLFLNSGSAEAGSPLAGRDYRRQDVAPGGERWYSNAATRADFDGDGHVDLVIGNYFPDGARILDSKAEGQERMHHSMSRAADGGKNRLLLWRQPRSEDGRVVFEEAKGALPGPALTGWTLALGAADLDGDLLPELYVANDFGPDRLLHNRTRGGQIEFAPLTGTKTLTTPSSKVLGRDSFKGMGVDFADLNGDGILDIYVSNIASDYALHESHFVWVSTGESERMKDGKAPYTDLSEPLGLSRSGWSWESRLADFDNDGVVEAVQATGFLKGKINRWPELHETAMGNDTLLHHPASWPFVRAGDDLSGHLHNPFFVRSRSGRFFDLAPDLGQLGEVQVTRGIATADIDGDGDLDFAVANQWEDSYLFRNDGRNGRFLAIHLRLSTDSAAATRVLTGHPLPGTGGRPAIGASVRLDLGEEGTLVAQVDGGNGHSGVRSPDLHFGLGGYVGGALRVGVRWRDEGGSPRQESFRLRPGWHTIILASLPARDRRPGEEN